MSYMNEQFYLNGGDSQTEEFYKLCDTLKSRTVSSSLSIKYYLNIGDFSESVFTSFCELLDSSEYYLGHSFGSNGGGEDQVDFHDKILYLTLKPGVALELTFSTTTYPVKAPGYKKTNLYVRGYVDPKKDLLVEVGNYPLGFKVAKDNNGNHPSAKIGFCRISKQPEHEGRAFALSTNEGRIFEVCHCEQPETGGQKLLSEALVAVDFDKLKQRFSQKINGDTGHSK